jgi:choline dehydrogenase-like flavoprotein
MATLKPVDAVVIGVGWTGGIVASELTKVGLTVVGLAHTTSAVIGADPHTSVVNKYGQSWDASNVFVLGASAFPQNAGYNPTGTLGALALSPMGAVVKRYIKSPGNLA